MRRATLRDLTLAILLLLVTGSAAAQTAFCDIDADGDVDTDDIGLVLAARDQAATGPDDPRDPDGDGVITLLDARACVLQCTLPRCARPAANTAPVADAGPDQTAFVGDTVTLNGGGSSDADGDPLSFSWTLATPAGSAAILSDPTAVAPTFVVDEPGSYLATLVVNDGTVDSAPDTSTVSTLNSPPVANAGADQTAFVGDTVTLDGSGSSDVDGDPLTFSWSLTRPPGSLAALSDPTAVAPTFVVDEPGSYIAQLLVNDGTVNSAPDTSTVSTLNSPPVANAGADQTAFVGDTVTLDGSGSFDVDGDPLSFFWSLTPPPGSLATLSDPSAVTPTFVVDEPGSYVAQLIVNDTTVDSAPDTSSVSTLNSPPVANAGADQTAFVGDTVTLDGSGSFDVDGDALSFFWSLTPPPGSLAALSDPTAVAPTFVIDEPGSYVAQLIVNDGTVDGAPDTSTVSTLNSRPVADAGPDQAVFVGDTVTLDGSGSFDVDGDPLTFSWSLTTPPGSLASLSDVTAVAPVFVPDLPGQYLAQLIVDDGLLSSDPDSALVTASPLPQLAVAPVATLEGAGGTSTDAVFQVTLSAPSAVPVSVDVQTVAGSAAQGVDYTALAPTTIVFAPGQVVQAVAVTILGDDIVELDETFQLVLSNPVAADIAAGSATGTIVNDDAATLVIDDVSQAEGDAPGTTAFTFTVTLDAALDTGISADFVAVDGTATTADNDYAAAAGTLTFAGTAGETQTVTVTVNGDDTVELDETFTVVLSNLQAGGRAVTLADDTGLATIVNDDAATLVIDDVSQAEGDAPGTTDFVFTVTLDAALDTGVSADFATLDGTATTADGDYTAAAGTLTFAGTVGETQTITVTVNGDDTLENDETFSVVLSNLQAAGRAVSIADDTGAGTVVNDDSVSIAIADAAFPEGDAGTTALQFDVTLTGASAIPVALVASTADGSATAASGDYAPLTLGLVSFPPGSSAQTVTVDALGDTAVEPDETFLVNLATGQPGVIVADAQAQGTILNDDAVVTIGDVSAAEGDSGTTAFDFVVSIAQPSALPVTVTAQTTDGTATAGSGDYAAVASTPVTIVPGTTSQTVTVQVNGDTDLEPDETFTVDLSAPVNATIGDPQGQGTIVNDDAATILSLGVVSGGPPVGVGRTAEVQVSLSAPAPAAGLLVTVTSSDPGVLDVPAPGTVLVPAGASSALITVNGVSEGSVTLTASAPGAISANLPVDVTLNLISLDAGLEVAPGQTTSIALSITSPAPPGGLTVSLTSSDPALATVTPSVFIPAGVTIPAANPQVTGVSIGVVQITGEAPNFAPDVQDVTVTIGLSFSPAAASIPQGTSQNLTLNLSAAAPAGGLTIGLLSDDPATATVPAQVTVPAGQTSAVVPVTAIAAGATIVRASAPLISEATAAITVTPPPPITARNVTVGDDLQQVITNALLSQPAPAGNLQVTITSLDPSRLLVAASPGDAGSPSVTVQVNAGNTLIPAFHLQGLADTGTVDYTISAPGATTGTGTVTLVPSGFLINTPGNFTTNTFANDTNIQIVSVRLRPSDNAFVGNQPVRGGLTVPVSVISSNTSVGVITTSPVNFNGGNVSLFTTFQPLAAGASTISLVQPAGFDTPASNQSIVATVTAPSITFQDTSIGEDLQLANSLTLQQAPPVPTDVTLTVTGPGNVLLSDSPTAVGSSTLTIPGVTSTFAGQVVVQGVSQGTTTVLVQAAGYADRVATMTVAPSGFIINVPGNFTTNTFANNTNIQITASRLSSTTLTPQVNQQVRAGVTANVPVVSTDPAVGAILTSPVVFNGGDLSVLTPFEPLTAGVTTIQIVQPGGFDTPSQFQSVQATVDAPVILLANSNVGEDLQVPQSVSLQQAPPVPTDVTLTVADPSVARISADPTVLGSGSVTFPGVTTSFAGTVHVQGLVQGASTTILVQAAGFQDLTRTVTVGPSGFLINFPVGSVSTNTFAPPTSIQLVPALLNASTLQPQVNQRLRGGLTASVGVTSSDPTVGTITTSPVVFSGGDLSLFTELEPQITGDTLVTLTQPAGFETPAAQQTLAVTVSAPTIIFADTTVGEDLQQAVSVVLQQAPPSPVDVTLTVGSTAIATIDRDPSVAGSGTVTFTGVTSTFVGQVHVQGRSLGGTQITVQAPGYADRVADVTVDPSGFTINSPTVINTTAGGSNINVQITASRLNPATLNRAFNQRVRGGLTVNVDVISTDPTVGTITTSPLIFTPNDIQQGTQFAPAAPGTTTVTVVPPPGFDTPSNSTSITANVAP